MTREKAIKILRKEIECLSHTKCEDCILEAVCDPIKTTPYDSEYIEAYGMAIKALEQEPCEDCISREAVDKAIQEWIENREYDCSNATYYLHKRIDKIPSVYPNTDCDGCEKDGSMWGQTTKENLAVDCISRAEAEALFREARINLNPKMYKSADEFNTRDLMLLNAEQMIHLLPSVQPKRLQKWIYSDLLRVKHGTMNIDALIDKVYADMRESEE